MARKRAQRIVTGILLLIPVVLIVAVCSYLLVTDQILQTWFRFIYRVFAAAIFSVVLYFFVTVTFTNLGKALKLFTGENAKE